MTPSKDWIYCPRCRQEICVTKCRKEIKKKEHWEVGNPLSGGYLDDYWYDKKGKRITGRERTRQQL